MIDVTSLDRHHRSTAEAILSHPGSHNIEWRDVLSLLQAIGEVSEAHNGKFKIDLGGEIETLHRPSGKDIGQQTVVDLRRILVAAGLTADSLRDPPASAATPSRTESASKAILVIGYHGADVYATDSIDGVPTRIVPEDARGRLRTMHHKTNNPEGWYGRIGQSWYAELAQALRPAPEILIIASGKGHSNGMLQFLQYLSEHDPELVKRIAGSLDSNDDELTQAQILALARAFYGDRSPRDHGDGRWGEP